MASHRYHVLQGRPDCILPTMLLAFFRSPFGALLLDQHSRGAAGRNRPLNIRTLLKEKIPIPSSLAQQRVMDVVVRESKVAESVQRTVDAVLRYRARLVTDVVTGKLDVRTATDKLRDDTVPVEVLDAEASDDLTPEEELAE